MIKDIIFDLSEVIISGYQGVEKLLREQFGIPEQDFKEQKQLRKTLSSNLVIQL